MKKVYTEYCINHDKAEQLLEKYEQIQEVQKLLQKNVESLQILTFCHRLMQFLDRTLDHGRS